MPSSNLRIRLGSVALALAGVLFILYPAVRPWEDETTAEGATAAMSSGNWVAAHLFAMLGFILVPLGLLAVRDALRATRGAGPALAGAVTYWIGAGLTLPYYGAEDFGLHAVAGNATGGLDVLELVKAVRFQPVAITIFLVGLLLLGVGAVLVAVAVSRAGTLSRTAAVVFAVGFALFIPQFYAPPAGRIAHGVLVAVGSVWLALSLWRTRPAAA
ncbi:hypothetical protein Lfu02_60970 [Longispora fulva]|uniref:Uncharacterized protein n=1 Tax=Longispora fulva TaxID=619741 RepID=A0A8J7GAR7_9ACTN|nr:hypothetical protein [Longispora fulva]MBG6136923.1 hypothetical protein [Longispora fulva]GIG61725.1 hypothetical protein Lfu02_60970 [Longispora fulva]